jgi:hypothetical protein
MLLQYFDMYLRQAGKDAKVLGLFQRGSAQIRIDAEGLTDEYWDELADKTEGFSGRGISKLMLAVQVCCNWRDSISVVPPSCHSDPSSIIGCVLVVS